MNEKEPPDQTDGNGSVTDTIREYRTYARTKRRGNDCETAGTYYVAAGRGYLMEFRRLPDDPSKADPEPPDPRSYLFGPAIQCLLLGALCFRLAGAASRCRYHCEQGELIISDMIEEGIYMAAARKGLFDEIHGDFRLIGELGGHDEAYAQAAEKYETVENDLGWSMEGGFEDAIQIPLELADSVGMGVDDDRRNELMYLSLDDRIEFKRDRYPEIVDAVLEAGNWESELL